MATTPRKKVSVQLKQEFPKADAKRLKKYMEAKGWNATKAGYLIDVSPSVIESALNSNSMRIASVTKIQTFLNAPENVV